MRLTELEPSMYALCTFKIKSFLNLKSLNIPLAGQLFFSVDHFIVNLKNDGLK